MYTACKRGYQEIRNLFNYANRRTEITYTINNFFIEYVPFASNFSSHLVRFHTLLGYPLLPSRSVRTFWLTSKFEREVSHLLSAKG